MSKQPTGPALPAYECLSLLASALVGRVVYSHQALPAVEPVDFAVDGKTVVIRTAEDSVLAKAIEDAVVAFEADEYDAACGTGWSVTIIGESASVTQPEDVLRLSLLMRKDWADAGKDRFFRISIGSITGRRIHAHE